MGLRTGVGIGMHRATYMGIRPAMHGVDGYRDGLSLVGLGAVCKLLHPDKNYLVSCPATLSYLVNFAWITKCHFFSQIIIVVVWM